MTPGHGEPVTGLADSPSPSARLALVVVLVVTFSAYLAYNEDPWALGRSVVMGTAYLVAVGLSIAWLATTWKRSVLVLLLGTIVVVGGVYAISGGNGYPSANTFYSSNYSCVTTSGGLNSSGYPMPGTRTSCTADDLPYQSIPLALGYNLLAWVPLVGCFLFSMPAWNGRGASRYDDLGRLLGGSVPAAAILMNLVGIQTGPLTSLPVLHMPLNPYPAYGECDSMSSVTGCVYVNQFYVLADYVFWLGVAILASLAVSEVVPNRRRAGGAPVRAFPYGLALALVLIIGLGVVPSSTAASGVLVSPGNSYAFDPGNSFVRVPFAVSHSATLSGRFESSAPVEVYLLNSSQFLCFDAGGGSCPGSPRTPLFANVTSGSISTGVGSGSYSLIFYEPFHPNRPQSIQVRITSTLMLSG